MAARSPTDFTRWHNHENFAGDKPFGAAAFDSVLDDMEMYLDAPMLLISDFFWPIRSSAAAYESVIKYKIKMKDDGSFAVSGDMPAVASVFAFVSGAGVTGDIRITSGAGADNTSVHSISSTSGVWSSFDTFNILSYAAADSYDELEVEMYRTAGTGGDYVALGGIGIIAT